MSDHRKPTEPPKTGRADKAQPSSSALDSEAENTEMRLKSLRLRRREL